MKRITEILYRNPFLLFALFVMAAYLPVFLPFFHLKNDLITQNLPTRYIISESLYSGYFPWWNPYIHFGIPQYGDMNNGFWNPFLWLIAKTVGYNNWSISFEEMFYILIGGWGIYKVTAESGISKGIAIITGISYISCGYITGHLQHFCWITGTAFFPYVLLYFLRINKNSTLKNYITGALAVFLFVSSTHPGLIIGAAYFFLFFLIIIFLFRKNYCRTLYQEKFLLVNLTFLLLSAVFSIVVIISNIDVLQHISRGSRVSLAESLLDPTSFQSYISLLFPLAVNKSSFFSTDISMRNVYMGLAVPGGFLLLYKYISRKLLLALTLVLLFFILLSAGGIFKTFFYYCLPLLGYVRLNGEFSYFVVLIMILSGAFGLHYLLADRDYEKSVKKLIGLLSTLSIAALVAGGSFILFEHKSIIYNTVIPGDFKSAIKNILDNLHFADLLIMNALFQLLTLFLVSKKSRDLNQITLALAFNLIITTWLILPFTGLGMAGKKEMDAKMIVLPHGIYPQELKPLNEIKLPDSSLEHELVLIGSYSKKIGYPKEDNYPVQLNTTKLFFEDTTLHKFINDQSFIFLSTDTTITSTTGFDSSIIKINKFGSGYLKLTVDNAGFNFITFLQNDYPYWETFINGKKAMHFTGYKTFITLPVAKGKQEIEFRFYPAPVRKALWINILIVIAGLILLAMPGFRNIRLIS